jgi:hypothetical protein
MNNAPYILTVSGIMFGFLFAGFWWVLNREISFKPEERHFKLSYYLLVLAIFLLGIFGIIIPLRKIVEHDPSLTISYKGMILVLISVYGYMLTELGHYTVFQKPKYITKTEWISFLSTIVAVVVLSLVWLFAG